MDAASAGAQELFRTGRKVGRTVYVVAEGPPEADVLVGLMDSPELAEALVCAANTVVVLFDLLQGRLESDTQDATASYVLSVLEPAWELLGAALQEPADD